MLDAHSEAGFAVGTPFSATGAYDFAQHGHLTRRVADLGAVMLRHRLTAPPEEVGKFIGFLFVPCCANASLRPPRRWVKGSSGLMLCAW